MTASSGTDGWPWVELGTAPTTEVRGIRRAYAARLKQFRPDEDPAGFARLRSAYDAALLLAETGGGAGKDVRSSSAAPAPSQPQREVPPDLPPPSDPGVVAAVLLAGGRSDVVAVARELAAARRAGTLGLADLMAFSDQLMRTLATDRDLPAAIVAEAANTMGWDGRPTVPRTPLLEHLLARTAAERWLDKLRSMATTPRRFFADGWAGSARLLLGSGPLGIASALPPGLALRRLLAEYQFHEPFVAHRFDAGRIAQATRLARSPWLRVGGFLRRLIQLVPTLLFPFEGRLRGQLSLRAVMLGDLLRRLVWSMLGVVGLVVLIGYLLPIAPSSPRTGRPVPFEPNSNSIPGLRQRAERGDKLAAAALGIAYARGRNVDPDPAEAARWFTRALPDVAAAATWLGDLNEAGQGMPVDLSAARALYRQAAERGEPVAQLRLAQFLVTGRGGPRDPVEAFSWRMRAARSGSPQGFTEVGAALLNGTGVAADPRRGQAWVLAAARNGEPRAMGILALLAARGEGGLTLVDACRWAQLALRLEANGPNAAELRSLLDRLGPQLDSKRRAQVMEQADDWRPVALVAPE